MRAEVAGVIGGVDLSPRQCGGWPRRWARAAVVVELETTTPDLPLVLSARAGEPVLVTLGDDSYEL